MMNEKLSDKNSVQELHRLLATYKTIAVVGLSADWFRPSFFAAKYMQEHGYKIIPVNPKYPEILGEVSYPSLRAIPAEIAKTIDMVDCFRKSEDILPIAQDAIAIGAKCVWQQLGVVNMAAHEEVVKAGLDSVFDRCVKIEHARVFGGLGWVGVNTKIITAKKLSASNLIVKGNGNHHG
jgi:uncharacterized protein